MAEDAEEKGTAKGKAEGELEFEGEAKAEGGTDPSVEAPPTLELRVAEVMEAGAHPNADRLLVLRIDLGGERRQLVAGLAGVYEPEALVGRRIVVVANLKAARLRGELSEGMLLASHGDGVVGLLLAPDSEPGTRLDTGEADTGDTSGEDAATDTRQITIDDFLAHDIRATPEGVTLDGRRIGSPRLVVDREAWGKVK